MGFALKTDVGNFFGREFSATKRRSLEFSAL